jgi:hypothetical protein
LRNDWRKQWIRDLITSRLEQTDFFTEQLDLFRDLDYQFAFRKKGGKVEQRTLGDLNLAEILVLEQRKAANYTAAGRELMRFRTAVSYVRPLLEAHSDWCWRDAVAYLESHGGLPLL